MIEWKITLGEILIGLLAAVSSIIALWISRKIEKIRFEKNRQLDIFRILMKYRNSITRDECVGALNLIEVDFHKHSNVLQARRNLQECFYRDVNTEKGKDLQNQGITKFLIKLLIEISKVLKIDVDATDIQWGNYFPQAWDEEINTKKSIDDHLLRVLKREQAIKIININADNNENQG